MRRRLSVSLRSAALGCALAMTFAGWGSAVSAAAPAAITSVVEGNNAFAYDLYGQLAAEEQGNFFFSPYSISTALAMTYAGAGGETAAQMARTLHIELEPEAFHPAVSELTRTLNAPGEGYALSVANALWGQIGYRFLPEFREMTARYYEAGFQEVDYTQEETREQARRTINGWVEERTQGKIQDLVKERDLSELTRLVLTNAIYFKGAWLLPFNPDVTSPMPFHLSPEETVEVPMMHQEGRFLYAENDVAQVLEMAYAGEDLSMVVLLPKGSDLAELEAMLAPDVVTSWLSAGSPRRVEVFLPRFKLEKRFVLNEVLQRLGMVDAFEEGLADFSGMTGDRDLYISRVIHQSFVEVNEEGTEAAAATAIIVGTKSVFIMEKPPVFRADRPFVFMIRDVRSGSILFMGRLADPRG